MQGWRTTHAGRLTYKTYAYKWLNHDKDGTYKSNCTNNPIEWQLSAINQSENDLNTHSGISAVKKEMMAEQIITKELIFRMSKMRSWKHYRLINPQIWTFFIKIVLFFIAFYKIYQILKPGSIFTKINKVRGFCKLGFETLPNHLSNYNEDLVH